LGAAAETVGLKPGCSSCFNWPGTRLAGQQQQQQQVLWKKLWTWMLLPLHQLPLPPPPLLLLVLLLLLPAQPGGG